MPEGMKAVDAALDRVASRMTPVIQNRALEAGWPEEVAAKISMVRSANGLSVQVEESVRQAAEDLEFGTMRTAPISALATLQSPQMKKQIQSLSRDSMDELIARMKGAFA